MSFIIHGILDLEGDLSIVKHGLCHINHSAPGLGSAGLKNGCAEFLDLFSVGIEQGHRSGKGFRSGIGNTDGHSNLRRLCKGILRDLHGDTQGIGIISQCRHAQQCTQSSDQKQQCKKPFLHN